MKLQERKIHEEKHTSVHLMLLFQTVMQRISIVGRNVRESGHLSLNEANLPTQKELEQFSKQVENALKENDELKSKVVEQEQRIQRLESARQNGPLPGSAAAAAFDLPLGEDLLKRINTEEAKTADLEVLFVESNKLNEELQRQVSSIARRQESSNGTVDRLQRQFESMSHSLALRNVMMTDLDEHVESNKFLVMMESWFGRFLTSPKEDKMQSLEMKRRFTAPVSLPVAMDTRCAHAST